MPKSMTLPHLHSPIRSYEMVDLGDEIQLLCHINLSECELYACLNAVQLLAKAKKPKPRLVLDLCSVKKISRSLRHTLVDAVSYHLFQSFRSVGFKGNKSLKDLLLLLHLSFPQSTQHFQFLHKGSFKAIHDLLQNTQGKHKTIELRTPELLQSLGNLIWDEGKEATPLTIEDCDPNAPFYTALNLVQEDYADNLKKLDAAQAEHRNLELNHSQIMNSVGVGIQISCEQKIVFVNDALSDLVKIPKKELLGLSLDHYIHEEDRKEFGNAIQLLLAGRIAPPILELRQNRQDAFENWVEIRPRLIYFQGERSILYSISDITGRKLAEKKIRRMAFHDSLTGLPNRILLEDRVETAIRRCRRNNGQLALIFIDLDRFKIINDTLGHHAGDRLLVETARRLSMAVRSTDTVSRYGGDEFVVLIPEIETMHGLQIVLEKIQNTLAQPIKLSEDQQLVITPSMGVSLYPDHGHTFETLMQKSDMAMYQAKDNGRNTYAFFDRAQSNFNEDRLNIESQIRKALEEKQFILHYQPQIDLKTKQVVGFEALIRWMHPKQGLIPPYQFITIAEESGLIEPMGKWVLEEACRQNKIWQDAGLPPVQMGVNISPRQFSRSNLIQHIEHTLSETGLEHKYLKVEITESAIMSNVKQNIETLKRIQDLGVSISVDDFGTGYSSLNYLKKFPISILKIDQSFVRDMTEDVNDAAIVRAIIAMGTQLQLELVAEGVETEAQLKTLYDMCCSTVQGYLFAKPLPAYEAENFLRSFAVEGHPAL